MSSPTTARWPRCIAFVATTLVSALLVTSCGHSGGVTNPGTDGGGGGGGGGAAIGDSVRWELLDAAGAQFTSLAPLSKPDRDAAMVTFLKASPLVADAGVADSSNNVWACFKDGRVALFLDNRELTPAPALRRRASPTVWTPPTELPSTIPARLLNSLDRRWSTSGSVISPWLTQAGYAPAGGGTRLTELESYQGDGVFYWATHAGVGSDQQNNPVFGFWTASKANRDFDATATYRGYWQAGQICVAFAAADQPDGSVADEWHYAITPKFVRDRMHLGNNCLVLIDACTSGKVEYRDAFFAIGAGAYCGWTAPISNSSAIVGQTMFDLLLAQDAINRQNPLQRPHDLQQVSYWMTSNSKDLDPAGSGRLLIMLNPARGLGLLRPTIFRMYVHDTPDVVDDWLEIEGEFGSDPGTAHRAVTIGGVAQAGVTWSPFLINVPLPLSDATSYGDVTVSVRGHLSNVAHLTRWELPVRYVRTGPGSLRQQFDLTFVIRGDIGEYRNAPFAPLLGLTHAISASKASTGTFVMSGIHKPNPAEPPYTKWIGDGSLRGARTVAETSTPGFMHGAGNANPTPRTITFLPQAIASYIIETERSSVVATAGLAGFGMVTLQYGADYVIQAKTLPTVTLPGGDTAVLSWTATAPDAPFNNGGR